MAINEPAVRREDILVMDDADFRPEHVCIVTGFASGIGRATALALAVNGLTVVGIDIDEKGCRDTREAARALGVDLNFVTGDLCEERQVRSAVQRASALGGVRYVANIAGVQHIDPIDRFPVEQYDRMQRLMLRAPFLLARETMPLIRRRGDGCGVIANMASIHAHISTRHKVAYNMVKFGLRGLTQSIAAEGEGKIRAFSVSVGYVKTPLVLNQIPAQAEQRGLTPEQVVTEVMMGKSRTKQMMTPVEVANLFVFGFSRHARMLIGGDLLFDGGCVLTY